MICYDLPVGQEVLARWQAELESTLGASPPSTPGSGRLSWPLLQWIAGDDWQPVGRWVVYDMCPAQVLVEGSERRRRMGIPDYENQDLFWLSQLNGPHPRARGRYDQVLKRFLPDPDCLIDRYQWDLWHRYKCHAFVFWIIQGHTGGHLAHYTGEDQQVAKLDGLPAEPPDAGALCYAPFDNRVMDKLRLLRLLQEMRLNAALAGATWTDSKRLAYRDALIAGKRTLLSGIDEYWKDAIHSTTLSYDGIPRVDGPDAVYLNEQIDQQILTS